MTGKQQAFIIHAPTAEALEAAMGYITNAFVDYTDSGEAPEQMFYAIGGVTDSDEDFEEVET